ncbi:MAG: hypothetical protein KKH83_00200 [Candidatus Margulisbacteria bacterium]|nr:hypothetical protein [Candidatus Margulisiibacteriota bacterium]
MPNYIPVNYGPYNGNIGTIDPSQFSRTGSPYTDSDYFQLYLAQALNTSSFDILFGNDEDSKNSIFGTSSDYSSLFGGAGTFNIPTDILGQGTVSSTTSTTLELIDRAALIGKTVTAVDPTTRKEFTGTVNSVSVESGMVLIKVGDIKVPSENLVTISS